MSGHRFEGEHDCFAANCASLGREVERLNLRLADSIDVAWRNVEALLPEGMAIMVTACGPSCDNPGLWHVSVAPDTRNGDAVYYAEGAAADALREIADAIVSGRKVAALA